MEEEKHTVTNVYVYICRGDLRAHRTVQVITNGTDSRHSIRAALDATTLHDSERICGLHCKEEVQEYRPDLTIVNLTEQGGRP